MRSKLTVEDLVTKILAEPWSLKYPKLWISGQEGVSKKTIKLFLKSLDDKGLL